jgi:hypothetical protein
VCPDFRVREHWPQLFPIKFFEILTPNQREIAGRPGAASSRAKGARGSGQIDHKSAGLMPRGLQMAAANLRHTDFVRDENERGFDFYHNQEEEELERDVAEEIAQEAAATEGKPQVAAASSPLPPKKEVAREEAVCGANQDRPTGSLEKS